MDDLRVAPGAPVFWDLDGTLIHSDAVHDASILHACRLHGLHFDALPPIPPGSSGPGVYRALFGVAGEAPLPAQYAAWYDATIDYVVAHLHRAVPAALAVDLCRRLAGMGVAQTLVSNSSPRIIDAALDQLTLRSHFTHLCSGDQVARGKPHADVYLHAAALHGCAPADCIAIEDSANGVAAARAAGVQVVAASRDPLVRRHADFAIDPDDAQAWHRFAQRWSARKP